jgi:preprotein translocase subunit SecG
VQVLSALAMIVLVLLQQGKGADMGASFGSGASGSLFGATGSANILSRSTAVLATLFFSATLGLTLLGTKASQTPSGGSVLDNPLAASAPASAPKPTGAALVPTQAPQAASAPVVAPSAPSSAP